MIARGLDLRGSFLGSIQLVACLAVVAAMAFGQGGNGTITGTVTDPVGAVVAGAAIEARNTQTGAVFAVESTNTGNYTISQLPIGNYVVTAKVEGFKTYLATAEADQIRFEEGEDIFSKYLPWAIAFDLADRWAKICGDLVAMGRLPNATPYWYVGSYNMAAFNTGFLTSSLATAAAPAPSSGASGTGFGGGSSFGGGGFSGGGGGGGGGGSW